MVSFAGRGRGYQIIPFSSSDRGHTPASNDGSSSSGGPIDAGWSVVTKIFAKLVVAGDKPLSGLQFLKITIGQVSFVIKPCAETPFKVHFLHIGYCQTYLCRGNIPVYGLRNRPFPLEQTSDSFGARLKRETLFRRSHVDRAAIIPSHRY